MSNGNVEPAMQGHATNGDDAGLMNGDGDASEGVRPPLGIHARARGECM